MTKRTYSRRTLVALGCPAARGPGIKTTLLLLAALLLAPLAAADLKPNELLIPSDDHSYPHAAKVRLVMANRNTHDVASLYATFPPAEARRLAAGWKSTTPPSAAPGSISQRSN